MTEDWQRKKYYDKRVLVPTVDVLAESGVSDLYCLTAEQVGMLRLLLAYAHRRSTFVVEYDQAYYIAPNNETWDALQAFVAELEEILMSGCCDDLVTALGALDTSLQANTAAIAALGTGVGSSVDGVASAVEGLDDNLGAIAAGAACLCTTGRQTIVNVTVSPTWDSDTSGATDYFGWGGTYPSVSVGPQVDEAACALAQAWYQAGYEFITEYVLPAMRFGFDKLLPAAIAGMNVITGGTSVPITIGIWAVAELIQELFEVGYDAAEANLVNWLWAHKQDIVCHLYTGLQGGGTSDGLWASLQSSLVDVAPDLTDGDKLIIRVVMGHFGLGQAKVAQEQDSPWFNSILEADYCLACPLPPIEGNDWVAVEVDEGLGTIDWQLGGIQAWRHQCWAHPLVNRQYVGMVVERIYWNGDGDVQVSGPSGCPGDLNLHNSYGAQKIEDNNAILYGDFAAFDEENARVALCPTGIKVNAVTAGTGTQGRAYFSFFTWFGGHIIFRVKYLIYSGAYWP